MMVAMLMVSLMIDRRRFSKFFKRKDPVVLLKPRASRDGCAE
jgi:hypothetical protein